MAPEHVRKERGFGGALTVPLIAAPIALLSAAPALAQGFNVGALAGATPVAIALGAGAFGLLAMVIFRRSLGQSRAAGERAARQISALRALVDQYEALLSGGRELTIIWDSQAQRPRILGQPQAVLRPGQLPAAALTFSTWLSDDQAEELAAALEGLRREGRSFELKLTTREGRPVTASGWPLGGGSVVRLQASLPAAGKELAAMATPGTGVATVKAAIAALPQPGYMRDAHYRLVYANPAYLRLARMLGMEGDDTAPPELLDTASLRRLSTSRRTDSAPRSTNATIGAGTFEVVEFSVAGGRAGYLTSKEEEQSQAGPLAVGHLGGVIDALATPVAMFNAKRELVQFNSAYAALWRLDPDWLKPGVDERAILDRLRTEGLLPSEADYHAWRSKHLSSSYSLKAPREYDPWHLPDGRTINVIAAPASPEGGVIYVFEDITAQLKLKSLNKALLDVQRSTLNALTEAVAVFGTNGRLTLSNPRMSSLWKLPMNELGQNPHIDQLAEACARALPEDGEGIWRDLKRSIIDLNPSRDDRSGRISRADGKLIDYAVVRLPDGQTMMTFLDVTESANYQRMLKERNDALVTADRLKDAFVQNVSYELRSPLTNIIGFADLLASSDVGELNERQQSYVDYIRASSVTLGVLIDNILDLATVDAGIAELRPDLQDVHALVEKARTGLAATFPAIDGQTPLNLKIDIPDHLPPFVADGTRIVQVLYNLLSSAVRFSEPGAEIRLTVAARGERMTFIVEDEGTATSEDMRAAILGGRDAPGSNGRQRGAGLGLAIVKSFVSLHGGTISVEPREPRGNRVVISLPRDAVVASAAE